MPVEGTMPARDSVPAPRDRQARLATFAVFFVQGLTFATLLTQVAALQKKHGLTDGELTIEAESTAWATQLRGLQARLLARITAEVGRDVVRRLQVHGPVAPSWNRGPKRVRGRGPRDTYG